MCIICDQIQAAILNNPDPSRRNKASNIVEALVMEKENCKEEIKRLEAMIGSLEVQIQLAHENPVIQQFSDLRKAQVREE